MRFLRVSSVPAAPPICVLNEITTAATSAAVMSWAKINPSA
jgi:hypothetical protein